MAHPPKLDAAAAASAAATARRWLENMAAKGKGYIRNELPPWEGKAFFDSVSLSDLAVSRAASGRVLCSFRVPSHLADADGNWSPGAIATAMDDVGGAAVMTAFGHFKVSVDYAISFFSPAKIDEEVEIEASVVENRGVLSTVVVEVRKKGGGDDGRQLVATGREWVASARPAAQRQQRCKL